MRILLEPCLSNPIWQPLKCAHYANVITASEYASGMHRGTDRVITPSVKLGEGGFGTRPHGRAGTQTHAQD